MVTNISQKKIFFCAELIFFDQKVGRFAEKQSENRQEIERLIRKLNFLKTGSRFFTENRFDRRRNAFDFDKKDSLHREIEVFCSKTNEKDSF